MNQKPIVVDGKRKGLLLSDTEFHTPVKGFHVLLEDTLCAELFPDGRLCVKAGSIWDYGTGAIDTPDVVEASLPHDVFCVMTNKGFLPWSLREVSDKYYRDMLQERGTSFLRRWGHWAMIRLNSKTRAYWKREEYSESN